MASAAPARRDHAAFIRASTALARPPLVPEIVLHLASEITPIWQATEAWLERSGVDPPYWAFAWPGGQALARHVLDDPRLVRGRTVLDFAAGCGIAAIACGMAGAAGVTACDIDPVAAEAVRLNADANRVAVASIAADLVGADPQAGVILCGDICYEAPMARHILPWLRRCAGTAEVLVADPGRAYLPRDGLEELARYEVPTPLELEDRTVRTTVLYRLLPG